jgi:hypothetical protein
LFLWPVSSTFIVGWPGTWPNKRAHESSGKPINLAYYRRITAGTGVLVHPG